MDKDTEIASDFTVGRYEEIRDTLDAKAPDKGLWPEVLSAFERRIQERFLRPIKELEGHDETERDQRPTRAGFAIMILDCVVNLQAQNCPSCFPPDGSHTVADSAGEGETETIKALFSRA